MIYSSFLKLLNYCVTIIFNHFSRNNVKRIGVNEEGVPKFLLSPMKILKIIISRVSEARIHLSTIVHPADRNQRTRLCTAVTSFDNTGSGRNFKAHLCLGHHRRLASPGIQGKTSEALEIEQLYFTNFLPFQRVSLKINLKRVIADVRSFVIIENICTRGCKRIGQKYILKVLNESILNESNLKNLKGRTETCVQTFTTKLGAKKSIIRLLEF